MRIQCPHCGAAFDVPAKWAGKRGKCKKCAQIMEIKSIPKTVARRAEKVIVACPQCGQKARANASWIGEHVTCPVCKNVYEINPKVNAAGNKRPRGDDNSPSAETVPRLAEARVPASHIDAVNALTDEVTEIQDSNTSVPSVPPPVPKPPAQPLSRQIVPDDPPKEPQPEASEDLPTDRTPEASAWCGYGNDLEADLALSIFRHDPSHSTPVTLNFRDRAVAFQLEAIPPAWVTKMCVGSLIRLAVFPLQFGLLAISAFANVMVGIIGLFTLNFVAPFIAFYNLGLIGLNALAQLVDFFGELMRAFQLVMSALKKEPFVWIPNSMSVENDIVATLSAGEVAQVIRLDASGLYLKRCSTRGEGCLKSIMSIITLPVMFALDMASTQSGDRAAFFAFVLGEPVDVETPKKRSSRWSSKQSKEDNRKVYVLAVSPEEADSLESQIASSLGTPVVTLSEDAASKTLWIP